jgi:ABC-type transporter Mla MlaB component
MRLDVFVHMVPPDAGIGDRLARIESLLAGLITEGKAMSKELDALRAEVERNTAVDQSAIALLAGLAKQIEDMKDDPVALQALADELRTRNDELAGAVAANTPQEPQA